MFTTTQIVKDQILCSYGGILENINNHVGNTTYVYDFCLRSGKKEFNSLIVEGRDPVTGKAFGIAGTVNHDPIKPNVEARSAIIVSKEISREAKIYQNSENLIQLIRQGKFKPIIYYVARDRISKGSTLRLDYGPNYNFGKNTSKMDVKYFTRMGSIFLKNLTGNPLHDERFVLKYRENNFFNEIHDDRCDWFDKSKKFLQLCSYDHLQENTLVASIKETSHKPSKHAWVLSKESGETVSFSIPKQNEASFIDIVNESRPLKCQPNLTLTIEQDDAELRLCYRTACSIRPGEPLIVPSNFTFGSDTIYFNAGIRA